jgi:hypothetical protein
MESQNPGKTFTEAPAMRVSATLPPFPTFTATNTLPPPQLSTFPYIAGLNDALPKENLLLARHFYADTVGHIQGDEFCYDIGIYNDDSYIVISCLPGFTYPAPNGRLTAYQSKFLHRWVESFQSFEEPTIHGLLQLAGTGSVVPEYADIVSMQTLIEDIDWAAHEYVHKGGYPTTVFSAREVLSQRLNKWLDDSSILKFEALDFPDTCLGVPKPNETCESIITPGFRIYYVADGLMYEYHTDVFGYDIRPFGEPQVAPTQGAGG